MGDAVEKPEGLHGALSPRPRFRPERQQYKAGGGRSPSAPLCRQEIGGGVTGEFFAD